MDLAGDDPVSDGGNIYSIDHSLDRSEFQAHAFPSYAGYREEGEMSPDDCASPGEPDSPHQAEKPAETAHVGEPVNEGPSSVIPGTSSRGNLPLLAIVSVLLLHIYIFVCQIFRLMISMGKACLWTLLCSTSCMILLRSMASRLRICSLSLYSLRLPETVILKVHASSQTKYKTSQFFD